MWVALHNTCTVHNNTSDQVLSSSFRQNWLPSGDASTCSCRSGTTLFMGSTFRPHNTRSFKLKKGQIRVSGTIQQNISISDSKEMDMKEMSGSCLSLKWKRIGQEGRWGPGNGRGGEKMGGGGVRGNWSSFTLRTAEQWDSTLTTLTSDPRIMAHCMQVTSTLMPAVCYRLTLFQDKNADRHFFFFISKSPTFGAFPQKGMMDIKWCNRICSSLLVMVMNIMWQKMLTFARHGDEYYVTENAHLCSSWWWILCDRKCSSFLVMVMNIMWQKMFIFACHGDE